MRVTSIGGCGSKVEGTYTNGVCDVPLLKPLSHVREAGEAGFLLDGLVGC